MGSPLIVLSSPDVITDIMERRSAVYSDKVRKFFWHPVDHFSAHQRLPPASDADGK